MKTNTLVLTKYATPAMLEAVLKRAVNRPDDTTFVILKPTDEAPASSHVVQHVSGMKGDVCDILWECAKLEQELPLLVASSRGYLYDFTLQAFPDGASIAVFCDEPTAAGFKRDASGDVIESAALTGRSLFRAYFRTTAAFTKLSQTIILDGKKTADGYELRTVINQAVLNGLKISVELLPEVGAA